MFAASIYEVGQVVSSIVGAAAALLALVFGAYMGIKKYRQSRVQKEEEDDRKIFDKFFDIEKSVEVLKTSFVRIQEDHTQLSQQISKHFEKIAKEVDDIRNGCVRHNHSYELTDLRKDVDRVVAQLDKVRGELDRHKQMVSDKYVPITSYQGDMQMWAQTFNTFQQSVRDLQRTLNEQRRLDQ